MMKKRRQGLGEKEIPRRAKRSPGFFENDLRIKEHA